MIKYVILATFSFMLGIIVKEIIGTIRQYKKIKRQNKNRVS